MTHEPVIGGEVFALRCSCGWRPSMPAFRLRKRAARFALTAQLAGSTLWQWRHHVRLMERLELAEASAARAAVLARERGERRKELEAWREARLAFLPATARACAEEWDISRGVARRWLQRWAVRDGDVWRRRTRLVPARPGGAGRVEAA